MTMFCPLVDFCLWVGGGLFVMGSCVVCAWCCYVLCGCMNCASPVRCVLLSYTYICSSRELGPEKTRVPVTYMEQTYKTNKQNCLYCRCCICVYFR